MGLNYTYHVAVGLVSVAHDGVACALLLQRIGQLLEEDAQPPRLDLELGVVLALPLALPNKLEARGRGLVKKFVGSVRLVVASVGGDWDGGMVG